MAFRVMETRDMKHPLYPLACGVALVAAMAAGACGGNQTTASKSAAAYDEATKKGVPIESEHGGHSAEPPAAAAATPAAAAMPAMDHSAMPGMDASQMPGLQHSPAATGAHGMAGMDHAAMPGMQHGPPAAIEAPASNTSLSETQPAVTLRPDAFDAPAASAIAEAAKGASGMSHSMEMTAPAPTPQQPQSPPPAGHHHHGDGGTS
jgi:hypothetical protein